VVEGTVYKYFESKRALLLTVMEQWYEGMVDDYTRDLAGIVGSRQRLRFIIWRHLRTIIDNPQLCRLLFREVRSELDYYDLDLHGSIRRYSKFIMDIVEEGVRANEFRSDVPLPLLRDMVFGCIEHRTWNYISGRGELNIDETVDQIMAILCDGIAVARSDKTPARSDKNLSAETQQLAALIGRLEKIVKKSEAKIDINSVS
jgi:AcrR family transcriptional regulator